MTDLIQVGDAKSVTALLSPTMAQVMLPADIVATQSSMLRTDQNAPKQFSYTFLTKYAVYDDEIWRKL